MAIWEVVYGPPDEKRHLKLESEGWETSDGGHRLDGTRKTIKPSDGTAGRQNDTCNNVLLWQCHIVYNKLN